MTLSPSASSARFRASVEPAIPAADKPVKLQYWSSSRAVGGPDRWPEAYGFDTVDDAVAFAMTHSPAGRDIAWLRSADGAVLTVEQIRRRWQLRHA